MSKLKKACSKFQGVLIEFEKIKEGKLFDVYEVPEGKFWKHEFWKFGTPPPPKMAYLRK